MNPMHQNLTLIPTIELWKLLCKEPQNPMLRYEAATREHERQELYCQCTLPFDLEAMNDHLDTGRLYIPAHFASPDELKELEEQKERFETRAEEAEHGMERIGRCVDLESAKSIASEYV